MTLNHLRLPFFVDRCTCKVQNMKKNYLQSLFLFGLFLLSNCGGGIGTNPPSESFVQPGIVAFNLGGNFPADIDIVDQPDLKNIAFITLTEPASVIAVDINKKPLALSDQFKGLLPDKLQSFGFPNSLSIVDSTHAFLLTSVNDKKSAIIYFNPKDGSVYQTLSLGNLLPLSNGVLRQVNGDGVRQADVSGSLSLSFPASIVISNSKLMISFSNVYYNQKEEVDHAVQGIIRFFDIQPTSIVPSSTPYLATECGGSSDPQSLGGFNATGLTALPNGKILVTCTGVTKRKQAQRTSEPITPGGVDLIDPETQMRIATLDLDLTAPGFNPWEIQSNDKAYLGSSTFGYLLEIKVNPLSLDLIHGKNNPILVTTSAATNDYINDLVLNSKKEILYAMSFNQNAVYQLSLAEADPKLLPDFFNLSFKTSLGGVSGAGPAALRPGEAGVDFTGPDLFVLTGFPGTMAAIQTY